MRPTIKTQFQNFIASVSLGMKQKAAAGIVPEKEAEDALSFLDALQKGRFRFEEEIWHDLREPDDTYTYPSEMLLRPYTEKNERIGPLRPITIIAEAGLQGPLDKAIIMAAIAQALSEKLMPISINTSARNMASADFWNDVSQLLRDNFSHDEIYGQLTFEVTEDDLANNPCREVLLQMKREFGCKFAIDDFYHDHQRQVQSGSNIDSVDWERLDNLKEIIDYVKIDGETVEEALQPLKRHVLEDLVQKILTVAPHAKFIFERVKDADEAHYLAELGHGIQGRHLTRDRIDFRDQLVRASTNFPPKPKDLGRP